MTVPSISLHDTEATEKFGRDFAARLKGGELIFLEGELGSGKTTFTRGLLAGLGGDPDQVASPTYTYLHRYEGGRLVLHHADLYRLSGGAESLELEECLAPGHLLVVEWPAQCPDLGRPALHLQFTHAGPQGETRTVRVTEAGGASGDA